MLLGKIIISGEIEIISGLHIGGATTGLKIGGVDLSVIVDSEGKPYIPGSSLKGKTRSLMEHRLGKISSNGKVHMCKKDDDYKNCPICLIWGISPTEKDMKINLPVHSRLIVRDIPLKEESVKKMRNLELEWTEVKTENVINRMKGSAESPRQIERVPAGAVFSPMEMIYNVFEEDDKKNLKYVFEALELLEHDYLGGMGSRGYGKVEFRNIKIYWNKKEDYEKGRLNQRLINEEFNTPSLIVANFDKILSKLQS